VGRIEYQACIAIHVATLQHGRASDGGGMSGPHISCLHRRRVYCYIYEVCGKRLRGMRRVSGRYRVLDYLAPHSLDLLGFIRPNRDFSMGYGDSKQGNLDPSRPLCDLFQMVLSSHFSAAGGTGGALIRRMRMTEHEFLIFASHGRRQKFGAREPGSLLHDPALPRDPPVSGGVRRGAKLPD
jgi:hypothetical protein